jgi:hypothetical protein
VAKVRNSFFKRLRNRYIKFYPWLIFIELPFTFTKTLEFCLAGIAKIPTLIDFANAYKIFLTLKSFHEPIATLARSPLRILLNLLDCQYFRII